MPKLETYAFFGDVLDTLDVAVCLFDPDDRTVLWNDAFLRFFPEHAGHVHPGEPYRDNLLRFYRGRLSPGELANIERYIAEGIERHRTQTRPFVFSHLGRRLRVASQATGDGYRVRIWQDIAPEQAAPAHGALWADFPIDLLNFIADGAMVLDGEDRIVATNDEFRTLYDVPEERSVIGLTFAEVVREACLKAGQEDRAAEASALDNLRFAGAPFEISLPGGRWRRVIARRSASGVGFFTHSDITVLKRQQAELKRAMDELSTIAATDVLTGLANRRRFDQALTEHWAKSISGGGPVAVMLIDLDHFKAVNDTFGHAAGDECLRRVAAAVQEAMTPSADVAARYGGEEFAVLLPNATGEEAMAVARSMRRSLRMVDWTRIDPLLDRLTVSIGICAVRRPSAIATVEAMKLADDMLYRAKNGGRDRIDLIEA
ncbi:sensor domain-containing diguanylate cyclase [Xanthobacter tagetidis]|uniref:sensor domain-containing diguanylate cyclase n=1 Tax=Xanthobacter tagetidis TaxID=60216 RepID=UPI0014755327|nr:sensor domain-containing diguanylate cyclase [Xanthobacter tagetidis]MBB6306188.1 diguanylate cyclase (GGDEF)-like protein [Xanthobacter tagetidis]